MVTKCITLLSCWNGFVANVTAQGLGGGVFVCDAGGELFLLFPWSSSSLFLASPCSVYLTTEHDTLGFADFDSEGAVGSGSLVVTVEWHVGMMCWR
jgi:hypothetical protein